jgi:hypothetical protein
MSFSAHSSRGCTAAVAAIWSAWQYSAVTLGWLFATTAAVVVITWRKQFGSNARRAMGS